MKKLALTLLCSSMLALTACDKKAENAQSKDQAVQTDPSSLSTNNKSDIKADFEAIAQLSTSKSQEALETQKKVESAIENDPAAAQNTMADSKKYFTEFNDDLNKLQLKSSEVHEIRTQMINLNKLTFDMMDQSLSANPDANKIMEFQKQLESQTAALSAKMQQVEAMIK